MSTGRPWFITSVQISNLQLLIFLISSLNVNIVKPHPIIIPCASIHPGQINLYSEVDWHPSKPGSKPKSEKIEYYEPKHEHLLSSSRTAEGRVSPIAKRKMMKSLKYLLLMANEKTIHNVYSGRMFKFKIAFVTLTLPSKQIHSDNEIKNQCLNQLLIELKKHYNVRNYIWRAEKQKNGNLHFHMLVDKFIPHQELRDRWNRIVNKLGYVDAYRCEMQNFHKNGFQVRTDLLKTWPIEKQKAAYRRGARTHWNSPNSTDIHSVQRIQNVKQYIAKYLTKNEIEIQLEQSAESNISVQQGRIWSCNKELSNIKGAQTIIDSELENELEDLLETDGTTILRDNYYSVIFFDMQIILENPDSQLSKLFFKYMIDKFNYNLQGEFFM